MERKRQTDDANQALVKKRKEEDEKNTYEARKLEAKKLEEAQRRKKENDLTEQAIVKVTGAMKKLFK